MLEVAIAVDRVLQVTGPTCVRALGLAPLDAVDHVEWRGRYPLRPFIAAPPLFQLAIKPTGGGADVLEWDGWAITATELVWVTSEGEG